MTEIKQIDLSSLDEAKRILAGGGVVAFPTETVYGLGADARNAAAVEKIYRIKGRPGDNPLIVHVHKDYDIRRLVDEVPGYAVKLAEAYLPGPLTMVYKSKGHVCGAVSCGLDTLAIRVPSHEGAQRFLKYVDIPVAAPSANRSKHVSPTTAGHVYDDLNGLIELILDGGACSGGIESTVLDCTGDTPVVLRSGLITREMIADVAGRCGEYIFKEGGVARSPGMKYKHYSPNCETALFESDQTKDALALYDSAAGAGKNPVLLISAQYVAVIGKRNYLCLGETPAQMAANLYSKLREAENYGLLIAIAPRERGGVMDGVMNRLTKACRS